jgi:small subunit ribosomal protein S17
MAKVPPPRPSVKSITGKVPAVDPSAKHGFRRKLVGVVTSNRMKQTVTVEVVRSTLDFKYEKYVTARARYKAHDEKQEYRLGDKVEIQEHAPISRTKRWVVTRLITRSEDTGLELKDEVLGLVAEPSYSGKRAKKEEEAES